MYGLLMLLPQSNAFKTLHARLHAIPTMALLKLDGSLAAAEASGFQANGGADRRCYASAAVAAF